ncbi:DUF916 domain-containing protein [Streptomyces fructofermentans]|uniref:WxL protein peptidoglycan domain-containing protein n=1 Tax=Streptomyces fructofermentans TaxID=152141 RepID=UPI0033D24B25
MHAPVTHRPTHTMSHVRSVALALLAALAFTGLFTGPARAADGDATWTVRTAANSYGDDRSSFSYAVNPGGQVKDAMVVANHGRTPLRLAVYAADGYTTEAGRLDLLTKDKKSVGVGAWVHAEEADIVIKPGKAAKVPFTAAVPADATPGDYVGGILTSLKQADDAQGINVDRRLGIRVKLRVGGTLKPRLAIENAHVEYEGSLNPFAKGDATLTYTVHNTGNTILSGRQTASVSGPFGLLRSGADPIAATPELLPGESRDVTVPVHGVTPAFRLAATATLTPALTDASGSVTPLEPVEATTHAWAIPWTLSLLVLVLGAGIAAAVLLVRRRRAQRKVREDALVQNAVEQALRDRETQQN